VCRPLANFSTKDAAAPIDLFSDLFAAVEEFLSPRPAESKLQEARNDPEKGRQRFMLLKGTDFSSERCGQKAKKTHDINGLKIRWWAGQDSNLQPDRYERPALTN
jgi:hypothetical protein